MSIGFVCTECKSKFTGLTIYRLDEYYCPVCKGRMEMISELNKLQKASDDSMARRNVEGVGRRQRVPRKKRSELANGDEPSRGFERIREFLDYEPE